jgi:hypothetical protein
MGGGVTPDWGADVALDTALGAALGAAVGRGVEVGVGATVRAALGAGVGATAVTASSGGFADWRLARVTAAALLSVSARLTSP